MHYINAGSVSLLPLEKPVHKIAHIYWVIEEIFHAFEGYVEIKSNHQP